MRVLLDARVDRAAPLEQLRMSAITAILDALVARGWVVQAPDAARWRRTHVDLAEAGRAVRSLAAAVSAFDAERVSEPAGKPPRS